MIKMTLEAVTFRPVFMACLFVKKGWFVLLSLSTLFQGIWK